MHEQAWPGLVHAPQRRKNRFHAAGKRGSKKSTPVSVSCGTANEEKNPRLIQLADGRKGGKKKGRQ